MPLGQYSVHGVIMKFRRATRKSLSLHNRQKSGRYNNIINAKMFVPKRANEQFESNFQRDALTSQVFLRDVMSPLTDLVSGVYSLSDE